MSAQLKQFLAGGNIPHACSAVIARGDNARRVGIEIRVVNGAGVSFQNNFLRARCRVPYARSTVFARGDNPFSVATVFDVQHTTLMSI